MLALFCYSQSLDEGIDEAHGIAVVIDEDEEEEQETGEFEVKEESDEEEGEEALVGGGLKVLRASITL